MRPHAPRQHAAARPADADASPQPARVLVVEDEYLLARGIALALSEAGFEVVDTVAFGEDAIAVAAREQPSLAIVDIRLAGAMDGIETARVLLREHGVRSIFATASNDEHTRARAECASPLGWLTKPYLLDALVLSVRRALGSLN